MHHLLDALFQIFNFAVLAGVLWVFGKKPVVAMFEGRRAEVARLIEEAERRREEAQKALDESRESLENAQKELDAIAVRAVEMGEALKKEIQRTAQAEAERVRQNTKDAIAMETRLAIHDIRQAVIDQAFQEAVEDFRTLPEEVHTRLLADFNRKVGAECSK